MTPPESNTRLNLQHRRCLVVASVMFCFALAGGSFATRQYQHAKHAMQAEVTARVQAEAEQARAEKKQAQTEMARIQAEKRMEELTSETQKAINAKMEAEELIETVVSMTDLNYGRIIPLHCEYIPHSVDSYCSKQDKDNPEHYNLFSDKMLERRATYYERRLVNLYRQDNGTEVVKCYRKMLEIRKTQAERDSNNVKWQTDLVDAHRRLAYALSNTGPLQETEQEYREIIAINEMLVVREKNNPARLRELASSHCALSSFLHNTGNQAEAEKHNQKALEILKPLLDQDKNDVSSMLTYASCYASLGDKLAVSDIPEAEKNWRESIKIRESLYDRDTSDTKSQSNRADYYAGLGDLMKTIGNFPEAEKYYRKSWDIEKNRFDHPTSETHPIRLSSYMRSCHRISGFMSDIGNQPEAESYARKEVEASEALLACNPKDDTYCPLFLCESHLEFGNYLLSTGNLQEAEVHYRKALEIGKPLVDHGGIGGKENLSNCYERLGHCLLIMGRLPEAEKCYRQFEGINTPASFYRLDHVSEQRAYSSSQCKMGEFMQIAGNLPEAKKYYQNALYYKKKVIDSIRPGANKAELAETLQTQSFLEYRLGNYENAYHSSLEADSIASTLTDIDLIRDTKNSICWCAALSGKFPEALAAGEKSVERTPDKVPSFPRMNLAHAYLLNNQFEKAKTIYAKYCGQFLSDGRKWNVVVQKDFQTLRTAGRDHPDMKKIETLLQESDGTTSNTLKSTKAQ
ncbi:TPA: hypothetical protein DDW35_13680 [Candidatus Sumerlaeota bacterium]|jgi:tetratricopeptide (TPR) repeat protein|nr:hypothetical protein [Candidatus Sumerlaeota bacterium]